MTETTFVRPEFRVKIDREACSECGRCVHQCGWEVYELNAEGRPVPDHAKCAACHRCVTYCPTDAITIETVSYTHLRAHETKANLVCRLLLEKKKKNRTNNKHKKNTKQNPQEQNKKLTKN